MSLLLFYGLSQFTYTLGLFMTQQILLPSVRVVYNYTTNILTAYSGTAASSTICHSTDILHEASVLASSLAGRTVSTIVSNSDNFLFR